MLFLLLPALSLTRDGAAGFNFGFAMFQKFWMHSQYRLFLEKYSFFIKYTAGV